MTASLPAVSGPQTQSPGGWKRSYAPDELLEVGCPRCGADGADEVAREFGIAIARCTACGLTYTRTPVPDSQSHYLVSEAEFRAKYGPVFRGEQPHPRDPNYDEHLDLLERHAPGRDLLDVGAHAGFFLRRAAARGWNVTGVEPSPVSSELARTEFGLNVITGALVDAALPAASFDAITLTDVFEHVGEPRAMLAEVRRLLRPGGVVFIKVPNVRYVRAKHATLRRLPGLLDDCFDAREHLVYYSASTLRSTLEEAGFAVRAITVPAPIQAGGALRRLVRGAGTRLARTLPGGPATPLATDLGIVAAR